MFSIGPMEALLLLFLGGVPVAIVILVVILCRQKSDQ
jgi:hypothetical protein